MRPTPVTNSSRLVSSVDNLGRPVREGRVDMVRLGCIGRRNITTLDGTSDDPFNSLPLELAARSERQIVPVATGREIGLGPEESPVAINTLHHVFKGPPLRNDQALHDAVGLGSDDSNIPLQ